MQRKVRRPHIPKATRLIVAERQLLGFGIPPRMFDPETGKQLSVGKRLDLALEDLRACHGGADLDLHHRPALVNRERIAVQVRNNQLIGFKYKPDANNPDFLIYLVAGPGEEHDVETRVRGQHGQHSDLALRRKRKRSEQKKQKSRPKRRLQSRGFDRTRTRHFDGNVTRRRS